MARNHSQTPALVHEPPPVQSPHVLPQPSSPQVRSWQSGVHVDVSVRSVSTPVCVSASDVSETGPLHSQGPQLPFATQICPPETCPLLPPPEQTQARVVPTRPQLGSGSVDSPQPANISTKAVRRPTPGYLVLVMDSLLSVNGRVLSERFLVPSALGTRVGPRVCRDRGCHKGPTWAKRRREV